MADRRFPQQNNASPVPTVSAGNNSVVTARRITNTTASSLTQKVEIINAPGRNPSGNAVPPADYTAVGGSVICAETLDGVNINEDINVSVTVKPAEANSDEGFPDLR